MGAWTFYDHSMNALSHMKLPPYPNVALSCQLPPHPTTCRTFLPTTALFCQLLSYPANCRLILPTAARSCLLPPFHGNCRLILPAAVLSSQLPPYPANCCSLAAAVLSCQPPPYPANCRPILLTAAPSCQLPPYPANCRPILPSYRFLVCGVKDFSLTDISTGCLVEISFAAHCVLSGSTSLHALFNGRRRGTRMQKKCANYSENNILQTTSFLKREPPWSRVESKF